MTEICQTHVMVSVAYSQARIQGSRMKSMHPSASHFQKCFRCINFFIINKLFDSNNPYALSTHIQKCASKMYHRLFGKALRIRNKIFKQNLPDNYSKSTKIANAVRKFSKFSGEAYPRTPLELFLFPNQLQICSAEKKYA